MEKLKRPDPASRDYLGQFGDIALIQDEAEYVSALEGQNATLFNIVGVLTRALESFPACDLPTVNCEGKTYELIPYLDEVKKLLASEVEAEEE